MSLPDNMPEIRAQGWHYVNSKVCSCGVKFEWFRRPNPLKGKPDFIPIEFHEATGKFLNHFSTCPHRQAYRKVDPKMLSKAQLKRQEREAKEAEREAAKGPRLFE